MKNKIKVFSDLSGPLVKDWGPVPFFYIKGISGTSKDEQPESSTNVPSKIYFFITKPPVSTADDYGCFNTSSTTFNKLGELGFVNEL